MATFQAFDLATEAVLRMASAADNDVDAAIHETLAALAQSSDADRAYVTMFHIDGTFENSHEWTAPDIVPQRPAIQNLEVATFPYSCRIGAEGKVLHARCLDDLPAEAEQERLSFGSFGVRSVLQVPVLFGEQLVGIVGFNHIRSESNWDETTTERVQLVAQAIGIALSRRSFNEQLQRAQQAAKRANQAMNDLVSRASHELRTPLHAVLGFAEILELDGVDHEALIQIRDNGRQLLSMIDDLLELNASRRTSSPSDAEALEDLVGDIMLSLAPVANQRGVEFVPVRSTGAATRVRSATRIRQVVHCAGSAAVVPAPRGGQVRASVRNSQPGTVEFRYCGARKTEPMGLGLALAQSFAEAIGATINVEIADFDICIVASFDSDD